MMVQKSRTKFNFTESNIANLPFAGKGDRYIVRDASTKNFILRVGEVSKVYYLFKKVNGRIYNIRLADAVNTPLKKAKVLFAENMAVVDAGKNPTDEKRKIRQDLTIRDFFNKEYYPKHCELSNKPLTRLKNQNLFKHHLVRLHSKKMMDITRADIENLHKSLGRDSIYVANRAMALLKHMYSRANAWGWSGARNQNVS